MERVLVTDGIHPAAARLLEERGVAVDQADSPPVAELEERLRGASGLIVRSATKVTAALLAAAPALKVVGRAGIGVDNIDVAAATARGIVVMNAPFANSITTAEHAIAMLLALARRIPQANASTHAGRWEKSRFLGVEVAGKTLGLIGCGNVGSIVADRAQGLKMKVLVCDPLLSPERTEELGVERVDLDELLARADFVSLHTPLNEATRGLLRAETFAKMKRGARVINCARGGLIVEADLKAALDSGQVAGAALDVFAEEPARNSPLFGMEQVVATPHLGASTAEASEKVAVQIARQVADYLSEGAVANAVNMPSVGPEELPRLAPYMRLAGQIGSFAGQLTETAIRAVEIVYEGHAAELNTKPLTAAALEGLLSPLVESVNLVNAPVVAKERGIDVSEVTHERPGNYQTLIRLSVTTETQTRSLAGTLFNADEPRIVEIKGIPIDARLGPYMLYTTNRDRPGFIGSLGKYLGDAGINIATFALGRLRPGSEAIALLEVDQPLPPEVLAEVQALPLVIQAKTLRF